MKKSIILICVFALVGCQTVLEDVAVPTAEVKAVVFYSVNNFGAGYSQLTLSRSKPVLNSSTTGEFEKIADATISLTGNGSETDFVYLNPGYFLTNLNYKFEAGQAYTLKAVTPENGTLTSTVIMPDSVEQYTLDLDSLDKDWEVQYNGRLTIPDNPDKEEYFRVEAFSRYFGSDQVMYMDGEYFSDENAASGNINVRFTTYSWDDENGERPEVYLILSAITKEHYNYGKTLYNYDPENPFSEPSPLPNNVQGGLGMFTVSNSRLIKLN